MKVLTIKEPWASLIIKGLKEYEFRSWKTSYRGRLLIHAGKHVEKWELERFKNYNLDYGHGEIIGEVKLTDCILVDEQMDRALRKAKEDIYKNDHVGQYAWKLENPLIYKDRIKIKGSLGPWNYKKSLHNNCL